MLINNSEIDLHNDAFKITPINQSHQNIRNVRLLNEYFAQL